MQNTPPLNVIFMGTPQFAAETLEYLLEQNINITAIVTQPDRPKGRSKKPTPPPVKELAQKIAPDIPIYQPEKASTPEFIQTLQQYQPHLLTVVAYGEIINQQLLDLPTYGAINLHASLLPKYRGAAPMQRCLMNGEKESGVTIIYMVKKMDAGGMIDKVTVPIPQDMNLQELEQELRSHGKILFAKTILEFQKQQKKLPATEQDPTQVSFSPKITQDDSPINWNKTAQQIHNQIRALSPKPGAHTTIMLNNKKQRLKILKSTFYTTPSSKPPASIEIQSNSLTIHAQQGFIQPIEVQPEGKKSMPTQDFIRGLQGKTIEIIEDK